MIRPPPASGCRPSPPAPRAKPPSRPTSANSAYSSPELAAPWAETLTDQNNRNSQIENVARHWLQTDRPAAEAWLAKVNLPDDRKQQLLSHP